MHRFTFYYCWGGVIALFCASYGAWFRALPGIGLMIRLVSGSFVGLIAYFFCGSAIENRDEDDRGM